MSVLNKQHTVGAASGRHLSRASRRVLVSLVKGRWRGLSKTDHWVNLKNLSLKPARSFASCPVCGYRGPFLQFAGRPKQICAQCGSRARHRVIRLAFDVWKERHGRTGFEKGLHIAPEPCLTPFLESQCDRLWSGDLEPGLGEAAMDLRALPIADGSLDFFFASHVLEHVVEDRQALAEVFRTLRPGGVAVLVVPITAEKTIEHEEVVAERNFHARDCGLDYFDRYRQAGFEVDVLSGAQVGDVQGNALTSRVDGREVEHWIPFCRKPHES